MRRFAYRIAVFLAGAVIGFLVLTWQAPHFIMGKLMDRVVATGGVNKAFAPPLPDEKARGIVLPSPDLAYVLCVYDLSNGPVTVSFAPPSSLPYWSIAAYADNTDNFLVINDRNAGEVRSLTLILSGQSMTAPPDHRVVMAPATRGVVLFRGLMSSRDPALAQQAQAAVTCRAGS